jgi:hypothetical protein
MVVPPTGFVDFWGRLATLNLMISSENSIPSVICSSYKI